MLCDRIPRKDIKINNNNIIQKPIINKETLELNNLVIIIEQMKTSVCRIEKSDKSGTGFLCGIPFPGKSHLIPVLITSYNILNKDDLIPGKFIKIVFYDKSYRILNMNKKRKIYTNDEIRYNITIIEIIKEDNLYINKTLKIDKNNYDENYLKYLFHNKTVYSIYYPQNSEIKYDINKITNIDPTSNTFIHLCPGEEGTLGAPILNLDNYKVIGFNKGNNMGTLLSGPINDFIQLNSNKHIYKPNEITLIVKIEPEDTNKIVYFLDNTDFRDFETNKYHYHDNLNELNKSNTKLFINDKEYLYSKYFVPQKEGIYTIKLVFSIKMTDCKYMFYSCYNLININLSSFDSSRVNNMSNMFGLCILLDHLDLSYLDTSNVKNMSSMFYFCKSLKDLNLSSINTKNVVYMNKMFAECTNITNIYFNYLDTRNVITMAKMFFLCKNLSEIDLSSFNTSNVVVMSNMFYFCRSLRRLDLRSFDTKKVSDMSKMFYLCKNLTNIFLSFDTSNVLNMSYMFADCKNLITLDLSSFNTRTVIDMSHFLSGCDLAKIDLSNFNTINVLDMSFMFYFCKSLKSLNLSSFNTKNVKNMSYMFSDCIFLKEVDLSSFDLKNVTDMSSMFTGCRTDLKIKVNSKALEKFKKVNENNRFYIHT